MTRLTIYNEDMSGTPVNIADSNEVVSSLANIGVLLEHWDADQQLPSDADQDAVIAAYQSSIDKLNEQYGFKSIDVVSLNPDHPNKKEFREKFLAEHTHDDFEVRFFVEGSGLFYLHISDKVYLVMCEAGDLISVPANTTHWFDMGENPHFKCIRLFTTEDGWVGNFTGSEIAKQFPDYDTHKAAVL
jgi:1,2-dihydroxy-3-keto-5-methylthiopentene dioxygenase